jgi:hypothetical protein
MSRLRTERPASAIATILVAAAAWASPVPAAQNLTYQGDNQRTGWNARETILTPATVASSRFGPTFSVQLDALTFGQPLVATGEQTPSGTRDLVIVATMRDTVYALDAQSGAVVWRRSLLVPGVVPVPAAYTGCPIAATYGIVSTPVIDRSRDAVYVVGVIYAGPKTGKKMHYYLHALSLSTGADAAAPVRIEGSTQGPSGPETFIADVQTQRAALVEANGRIYVTFGGICDFNPTLYHGWIFAYDPDSLALRGIYDVTPAKAADGTYYGGIWMSGSGVSVEPNDGSLIFAVGNGTFDGSTSFGDSVVRVSGDLRRTLDFFTPYTVFSDNTNDADFGAGGVMLLPDARGSQFHLAVAQGKDGILTLMNRSSLGGYTAGGPDRVFAELNLGGVWSAPAYWANNLGDEYVFTTGGPLYAVRVTRSPPGIAVVGQTREPFPQDNGNGATPTVSSNGSFPKSAVVWIVQSFPRSPGSLRLFAYAATDLSHPVYGTSLGAWNWANTYIVPAVANGTVYVAGEARLNAFSLH